MAKKKPKKLTKKQKKFIIKNYKIFLILLVVLIIALAVIAFVFKDQLREMLQGPKPTTRSVHSIQLSEDGILSWGSVGDEAIYTIEVTNEEPLEIKVTSYDIKPLKDKIKTGLIVDIYAQLPNAKKSYKKSITVHLDIDLELYSFEYNYTYEGYYGGLDYKMSDDEIFDFLHKKINIVTAGNGSENSSYGEVREILVKSDIDPKKPNTLWGIYDNAEIPPNWGSGNVFQREHVWPNSRLGIGRVVNNARNQGSDPHNLRAIIGSTNSSRSNRYFVNGSGANGYTIGTDQYYPGDEHRGDVARILMYMAVRYKDILSLVETPGGKTYEPSGAQMGQLSLLLDWHNADPVDEFEVRRNEIIFEYQGNRNPFIDHPELFERVYDEIVKSSVSVDNKIIILNNVIDNINIQNQTFITSKRIYDKMFS